MTFKMRALMLTAALWLLAAAPGARAVDRLYWSSCGGGISFANLNDTGHGGNLKTTPISAGCPQGVAMDLLNGKLYWPDTGEGGGTTISFANLNDSGGGAHLDTTGATPPHGPFGIATDPATGKLYWGNYNSGALSFAKLNDTGGGGDLDITGAASPTRVLGVAVDPATGKIYWDNGGANKISYANLNGTGHGGNLDTKGATVDDPEGVAIDPANGRIYWANLFTNTHPISFANVNDTGHGGNLKLSGASPHGASGVALDPETGKIYWDNFDSDTISFANLNGSGGGGQLNITGATTPAGPSGLALLKTPLAIARPKVSGGSKVGSKLSCSNGKWAPDLLESFLYQRAVSFSYAWRRDGTPIAHATENSITASRSGSYTCRVTAINQAGDAAKTSGSHSVKA